MKRHAVIVAGGQGVRMGAPVPKQFLEIGGKPILRHTIERFLEFDPSIEIVLVLPKDQRDYWRDYCRRSSFLERYSMVSGGITRFHSVRNALEYVGDGGLVAVHDGVRPLLSTRLIAGLFDAAQVHGAAIPVVPVSDSVRRREGEDSKPVSRDGLVMVQTPQVFRTDMLKEAYGQPFSPSFTDDASVVEASGHKIFLVPGERSNIKVTVPDDLKLAEMFLRLSSGVRQEP